MKTIVKINTIILFKFIVYNIQIISLHVGTTIL